MSFPHGCGDHHFLYLKKLFRGEPVNVLFAEDEAQLIRAGWLRRNRDGALEVTEPVAAYFIAARRPPNEAGRRRTDEEVMRERLFAGRPGARSVRSRRSRAIWA